MAEHIVIIGGGIIGVCTAYYLSQDERVKTGSVSVSIVEVNEIASGASGKAGGFLALDWHGPATASLARFSYALHQQLAEELNGESVYGYRRLTSLSAHVHVPDFPDVHLVDPILSQKENLQHRPLPLSTGDGHHDGVAQTQWLQGPNVKSLSLVAEGDSTAQVHPLLFTRTLWDKAHARGVHYIKGRPTCWDQDAKTLKVDTPDGPKTLPAQTIVVTAGPWSGRVTKQLLGLEIPIFDLPGHSILVRPSSSDPLPAQAVFAQMNQPGVTGTPEVFVRPDGLLYVAGENHGPPLPEGTADVKPEAPHIRKLALASAAISDSLRFGTMEMQQLCYRPVTPHGAPLVGALKMGSTKAFVAAGHGVWGIILAPGTGKVMAEMLLDGAARSVDVSQLDPSCHLGPLDPLWLFDDASGKVYNEVDMAIDLGT